ncbi:hypothetical protein [Mycolicibacterium sp.]|nr:hypothetical protein [Mycolicibacterium sp.]
MRLTVPVVVVAMVGAAVLLASRDRGEVWHTLAGRDSATGP